MKSRTKEEKIDLFLPLICALVYVSSYLGRHSYNSNITQIVEDLGMTYTESGLVTTFFFFAYGAGQFIHGAFCSRYNDKYVIPSVLIVSSIVNLLVFCGIDFNFYKYLWLINGICLAVLWPTLIRILSKYISGKTLSKATVLMSGAATAGYCLTYLLSAVFSAFDSYRLSFFAAALTMLTVSFLWLISYNKLGLNNMGVRIDRDKAVSTKKECATSNIPNTKAAFLILLVFLSIYAILCNTIKEGLHVWVPSILKDRFNLSGSLSTLLSIVLSIFGLFASMLAVKLHKHLKDYLLQSELLFALTAVLIVAITSLLSTDLLVYTLILLGVISLLMHCACGTITSIAPLELRERMDSGILAGVLNGSSYIGSIISSYVLSFIADKFGWISVFNFLLIMALIPVACLAVKAVRNTFKFIIKK